MCLQYMSSVTEVNECELGIDHCGDNMNCLNSNGGYQCQCPSGYDLHPYLGTECISEFIYHKYNKLSYLMGDLKPFAQIILKLIK